jgi:hypothetical protein
MTAATTKAIIDAKQHVAAGPCRFNPRTGRTPPIIALPKPASDVVSGDWSILGASRGPERAVRPLPCTSREQRRAGQLVAHRGVAEVGGVVVVAGLVAISRPQQLHDANAPPPATQAVDDETCVINRPSTH